MRILFYLEPVIFRNKPDFLAPHTSWISRLIRACRGSGIFFGIATSRVLLACLKNQLPNQNIDFFELSPWLVMEGCFFRKDVYANALYGSVLAEDDLKYAMLRPLLSRLSEIAVDFSPDVVISSSQNLAVEFMFNDRLTLFYEAAPLPRLRRRGHMFLDPSGHQTNSMLTTCAKDILSIDLTEQDTSDILSTWELLTLVPAAQRDAMDALSREIAKRKRGRRIALLAMQPADWLSYEGAYGAIAPEAVIARWARALPDGWVGIPIFHPASRIDVSHEAGLSAEFSNLEFLPPELSQNVGELAIRMADGLVTISSTLAMTAGLAGIPVVVTGTSAFTGIFPRLVSALAKSNPLSAKERAALIVFLTHRYCHPDADFYRPDGSFISAIRDMLDTPDPKRWMRDLSGWSVDAIKRFC